MAGALSNEPELEAMAVVANNAMNRERGLAGRDGYCRQLSLDPLSWLRSRSAGPHVVSWLDLCCGAGRALREAAALAEKDGAGRLELTGVDLIAAEPTGHSNVTLIEASLRTWRPVERFDLITCVHGLHYVGDKLGLLSRIATWLADDGRFVASFDADSIRTAAGQPAKAAALRMLRRHHFTYDSRRHLLTLEGPTKLDDSFRFVGADPQAGPNYTGQPAVNSHYEILGE